MKQVSVFNSVLGPVMRGPSSSHTGASYHIGRLARDILGERPERVEIVFDERGSYGKCYLAQGSDKAFATGLMDWDLLDDLFHDAVAAAGKAGTKVDFSVERYDEADHPNWTRLTLRGTEGAETAVVASSIGGGSVIVTQVDGFRVDIRGDSWVALLECPPEESAAIRDLLEPFGQVSLSESRGRALLALQGTEKLPDDLVSQLVKRNLRPRVVRPIFFPVKGAPIWGSAAELEAYANERKIGIGEATLDYECALLGLSRDEAMAEMWRRYGIMKSACERALAGELATSMQLLRPTAQKIFEKGQGGKLPFFGLHTRAAVRAMALMHANGAMDVVCAAPTGGSAGALPGAIITLEEELNLSREGTCLALFAAGGIGVILDTRATFAAEVAGCQVEIGAGGAMASAACAEAAGATVREALDAASISFQNTMGSICDPVQGMVEIPCHTRNASAAAGAFVNADLILGGYENDIPLDEAIDAVYEVGKMLPAELRCTALGGLSICPSAMAMRRLR